MQNPLAQDSAVIVDLEAVDSDWIPEMLSNHLLPKIDVHDHQG